MDETQIITTDERAWLVKRTADVKDKMCYVEILDLIHTHGLPYTVNNNGVFFNMGTISDALLYKIRAIVKKYENRKRLRDITG